MKKGVKVLIVILSIIAVLIIGSLLFVIFNPRAKFLAGITRFATGTLSDNDYIGYNLDVMELCREYANGDIEFSGEVIASDIKGFGYTSSAKVHGQRSFDMKELSGTADAKVLFVDVGEVDFYAKDKTMYMIVPSFDNLAYSLTSDADLFYKAPMLNGNLDFAWFKDNISNFIDFANDIDIRESGQTLEDDDGTFSTEYLITIPKGEGGFIWELLGMDVPTEDINLSMYITRSCKIRRISMDISNILPDTRVIVDGTSMGTVIFEKDLPENEKVTVVLIKRGDYKFSNCIDVAMAYNSRDGKVYKGDGILVYEKGDNGYDIQAKRLKFYEDDALIGQMYFNGNVHPTKIETPPVSTAPIPLDSIKNYSWEELRDNFESFINDVTEDVKSKI